MDRARCEGLIPEQAFAKVQCERNVVKEMICEIRAVKPTREPKRDLQTPHTLKSPLLTNRVTWRYWDAAIVVARADTRNARYPPQTMNGMLRRFRARTRYGRR